MPNTNELDEFFDGLPSEDKKGTIDDIFTDEPKTLDTPVDGENKGEDTDLEKGNEPRKNRRHRRLEQQLEAEREARIRAEALAEARLTYDTSRASSEDVDPRWIRIYGDTPEAREAWRLQKEIFDDYKTQTREEALRELNEQRVAEEREQRRHEELIENELEELEDEYNVDLTSNAPAARKARREFLEMIEQASPKDEDGNVISYADFGTVYNYYQLKQSKGKDQSTARQKEISSRSMTRGNSSTTSEQSVTPGFDGWRKDFNLE